MSKMTESTPPPPQRYEDNIKRTELSNVGQLTSWTTCIMMLARAGFLILPLVYILGADNWIVLVWFGIFTAIFGINLVFYLCIFGYALSFKEGSNKVFGEHIISWNPLRRFYVLFMYCVVDYVSLQVMWWCWFRSYDRYLNSPNNSNTPDPNAAGFYPFQMMCGAFIFTSVIYFVFAFQLIMALWSQRQDLTELGKKQNNQKMASALGQVALRKTKNDGTLMFPNIELGAGLANKLKEKKSPMVQAYIAVNTIYHILIVVYLGSYVYHVFDGATKWRYVVTTVFLYASLLFWLIGLFIYYFGGYRTKSIRELIVTSKTSNTVTHEANSQLDAEMSTYYLSGFFFYFFNIIFAVYAYSLSGPNAIDWQSVPQFNPAAIVQSPFFYVWLTTASLNTGVLCFCAYNAVVFVFSVYEGGINDETDEDEPQDSDTLLTEVEERPAGWIPVIVLCVLTAIWIVFYGFVLEAMLGGHFLAKYIFPITIAFALVFFFLGLIFIYISNERITAMFQWGENTDTFKKTMEMNRVWYLSTIRNVVSIPLGYIISIIILSVTISQYFESKTASNWQCINPISSSSLPPYSSCNIYWAAAILALYCVLLVYLVCIINAFATLSVRIQIVNIYTSIKGAQTKKK